MDAEPSRVWRKAPTASTTVTDKAGNVSERSPAFELTIDTTAPAASIPQVTDNVAEHTGHTGQLQSGDLTNDATPTA
ncbi:hypothetical protein [Klebsiella michiganensis]|uniref:hypothetical protein n=1 Tax=Klebsiella michiganensis TaxID=1134687 RepID=UPI0034A0C6CB